LLHRVPIVYRYNLNYRPPRNHLADRWYSRRVAACVFQSRFIQDLASEQEPWVRRVPAFRVANGYDIIRFAPGRAAADEFRRKWRIPADALVVLTSAKLEPGKGHEVALAALNRVYQHWTALVYVVCGNGAREQELRALASAGTLPVCFTGLLETDELVGALNAAHVVVHPSLHEIFPNAVGEAMACARPVVAADAGGTGELLGRDGSTGVLVPPGDPDALAREITGLLANAARRITIGGAARSRVKKEFSLDQMIDGYESALEQVIGSR
jgi:glycosyltransferase involved in cell wall biosynthesis